MEYKELSHPQKRIYIAQNIYKDCPVHNIGGYAVFRGRIDKQRLGLALWQAVKKMDAFSIRLTAEGGDVVQYFSEDEPQHPAHRMLDEKGVEPLADELIKAPLFGMNQPLYRIHTFEREDEYTGYFLCFHHIISDGWSIKLFTEEVGRIYDQLEETGLSCYRDYLEREREYLNCGRAEKDFLFWKEYFNRCQSEAKTAVPRPWGERLFYYPTDEEKNLLKWEKEQYGSHAAGMAAAFFLMQYLKEGSRRVFLNIPAHNRGNRKLRNTAGMFTSTMLIGLDLYEEMEIHQLPELAKREINRCLKHQQYPFDRICRDGAAVPSYSVSINCYTMDLGTSMGGVKGVYHEVYPGCQPYPLQIVYNSWDNAQDCLYVDYQLERYDKKQAEAMIRILFRFFRMLRGEQPLSIRDMRALLREQTLNRQLASLGEKGFRRSLMSELLNRIGKEPQREALYDRGISVTQEVLAGLIGKAQRRINQTMGHDHGPVLLLMDNSAAYIVYALALLALGKAFIPLDKGMPEAQLAWVQRHSAASLVITDITDIPGNARVMHPELDYGMCGEGFRIEPVPESDTAYIIYTSGTTGVPKGVVLSRKAIAAYLSWTSVRYTGAGPLCFFLFSSPAFDLTLTSWLLPLISGGCVVLEEPETAKIHQITKARGIGKINALKATPSQLELLIARNTEQLKLSVIISGGEELTVSLALRLRNRFGEGLHIYNEYGPTEAAVGCMCHEFDLRRDTGDTVSIGKAAPWTDILLLTENGEPAYGEIPGQICIGGEQLADGYLGESELTDQAFVTKSWYGKRLYLTGDIAYLSGQGEYVYCGRMGRQKKVNGYRIELSGVEAVIKNIEGVTNCIVDIAENGCRKYLAAVVETSRYDSRQIREIIGQKLPEYSVPQWIHTVDHIPLTRNGKPDFLAFFDQEDGTQAGMEPGSPVQMVLLWVMEQVFGELKNREAFHFFQEGGDSIKAITVSAMMEQEGIALSVADILMNPKLEEMAACAEYITGAGQEQEKEPAAFQLPQNVRYLKETGREFTEYRQLMVFLCKEKPAEDMGEKIARRLAKNHPLLCMYWNCEKESVVPSTEQTIPFSMESCAGNVTEKELAARMEKMRRQAAGGNCGLCWIGILNAGEETYLGISLHHIAADGTTWDILLHEIWDIMEGRARKPQKGEPYELFAKRFRYHGCRVPKNPSVYRTTVRKSFPVPEEGDCRITDILFYKSAAHALGMQESLRDYTLYLDFNARTIQEYKQFGRSLGCFSMFLPVNMEAEGIENSILEYRNGKQVFLEAERIIRVNFLGDLGSRMPEGLKLQQYSVEESLKHCGGGGCLAEFTGYVCQGFMHLLVTYAGERDTIDADMLLSGIESSMLRYCKKKSQGGLPASDLVALTADDLAMIFE